MGPNPARVGSQGALNVSLGLFVSLFYFMVVSVLPQVCLVPRKPEEGVGSPGTRITNGGQYHVGAWNRAWVLEWPLLLTAEPSPQPHSLIFCLFK